MDDAERRAAERKLASDLKPLQKSKNALECAPAFAEFARALFSADAGKLLTNAATQERFDADLEALLTRVIEGIMPDASLDIARASRYLPHGDWERLAPAGVRSFVRRSLFPKTNAAIRAVLESALRAEKMHWMGRFHERAAASGPDSQSPVNTGASMPSSKESGFAAAAESGAFIAPPRPTTLEIAPGASMPAAHPPQRAGARRSQRSLPINAKKLRELRGEESQEDFADKCGISVSTLQRGENGGRWLLATIYKVAKRLRRDPTVLTR